MFGQNHFAFVRIYRLEILFPLVGVHIGPFAGADGQLVHDRFVLGAALVTLLDGIEGKAVGQGLATHILGGIHIDTPLGGNGLGVHHQIGRVANSGFSTIKVTDNINLIVSSRCLRHDCLYQNLTGLGLEGLLFVAEAQLFPIQTGGRNNGQGRKGQIF